MPLLHIFIFMLFLKIVSITQITARLPSDYRQGVGGSAHRAP